jgi:sulfatase maturation enzyme AslB (radical SAM superfamily)
MSEKCLKIDNHLECYAHENQLLAEHFLQTYFFDSFRYDVPKNKKQKVVELIISPKCNLGCKYCYIHRHKKEIFDENIFDEDLTIKNLKLFLQWIEK